MQSLGIGDFEFELEKIDILCITFFSFVAELIKEPTPLKAIDFCYHDEDEMVTVLDCITLCVMVVSYSAENTRGYQMLVRMNIYFRSANFSVDNKDFLWNLNNLCRFLRSLLDNFGGNSPMLYATNPITVLYSIRK